MKKKNRINFFSLFTGILIDLALIGTGVLLYYLGPVFFSPIIVNLFGSLQTAVLVISGLPFIVGVLSLLKTLIRPPRNLAIPSKSN
jgi:hypothetical protein